MDLPDLYDLVDIEGSLELPSECDAFLPLPQTTASPATHQTLAIDTGTFEPPALRSDTWTSEQDATPRQRQRRYAPRSRQGCLTCRARRKRCDIQHPVCRTCTRVNAECRWPEKLQVTGFNSGDKSLKNQNKATAIHSNSEALSTQTNNVNDGSATDAYLTASIITNGNESIPRSLAAETMFARQLSPTEASRERYLLTYYIHTFIPQVTLVQSPSNFFTSLYIPMAFHYSGVMDAIIASSAAHLAKSVHGSDKIKELNSVAIRRQQLAREFVTEHTTCPKSSGWEECKLEVVVVLLLLIGLESQTGGRSMRWMQRVNCVRQLLQTYPTTATKTWSAWEAECVHRHFLYHDVMSLIMEDVLDPETQADLSKRSGPFSDCAATLSVPRTQDLSGQEVVTKSTTPSEFHHRDSELIDMEAPAFLKIETDLTNWQYDHATASALDFNTRLDLIALSECHRLTELILLYRRYPSRSYCLPHLASQIISVLSRITPSSAVISALTPVLFLAGAELNSEVEMALCAARLKSIREANKMMNIAAVEEILRVIWEERLQKKGRTDWLEILRTRRWTLSLG
ncbi:hypothetical protein TsFJ059_003587 [Trichoderma semiorbis]|uniref:Zn(2)-C6 fungal-type domain-containing protein n=1 Tax=Trichoderma semiorbis TaxID=1491008 RepID=A0A9P8KW53_9HYPO|nr:hypothetical protein TsFJ059_003587 [Trichoderma semiorbis]